MEEAAVEDSAPIGYGDLRMSSDRRNGPCLFWVRLAASDGTLSPALQPPPPRATVHTTAPPRDCTSALRQVVPDVARGFNVPAFYAQFLADRPPADAASQGRS